MSDLRLISLSEADAETLDCAIAEFLGWEECRRIQGAYEQGITEEEAREAADWIRGHRPRPEASAESVRVGRALDKAVRKLRAAFEEQS